MLRRDLFVRELLLRPAAGSGSDQRAAIHDALAWLVMATIPAI
jgi:hypothetical protein